MPESFSSSSSTSSKKEQCKTKIQLFLNASKLPRTGRLRSTPDTFAQVSIVPSSQSNSEDNENDAMASVVETPVSLGATELFSKSCEPRWAKVFPIEYEYGTSLTIFVEIRSPKSKSSSGECESLGGAFFDIGDLLGCRNRTKAKRLRKGGCVYAHIEPCRCNTTPSATTNNKQTSHQRKNTSSSSLSSVSNGIINFQMSALQLKDSIGRKIMTGSLKPNTYFEISRQTISPSGTTWVVIYRSNPVLESFKPTWDRVELDLETFCNGDLNRPVLLSIFTSKKRGTSKLIGSFETSANVLSNSVQREGMDDEERDNVTFIVRKGMADHAGPDNEEMGRIVILEANIVLDGEDQGQQKNSMTILPVTGLGPPALHAPTEYSDAINMAKLQDDSNHHSNGDNMYRTGGDGGGDRPSLPSSISTVMKTTAKARPSFLDYIDNGCEVDFCVAIDFTSSNGDPRYPTSLHYNRDGTMNDYEETILSVGSAVSNYNSTKQFPVWGFGAKYSGEVRHIFQCGPSSTAYNVDGVLDAYRSVFLTDLIMSGPTVLLHVIHAAAARAKKIHVSLFTTCVCVYDV
uniref:Copine C-terminal domain-containing protein n=1 Tax=Ditylum brightwellii TaxID=49249 RepID=A0A7S4UM67_9STRA